MREVVLALQSQLPRPDRDDGRTRPVDGAPTIMRLVHHYVPEFERRWNRFARPVGLSCGVDETYVKIRGKWVYLYRTVDREGKTVDFRLSSKRDVAAAKAFFRKAIKGQGSTPRTITLDCYAASHRAVCEMKAEGQMPTDTNLRSSKYLNAQSWPCASMTASPRAGAGGCGCIRKAASVMKCRRITIWKPISILA